MARAAQLSLYLLRAAARFFAARSRCLLGSDPLRQRPAQISRLGLLGFQRLAHHVRLAARLDVRLGLIRGKLDLMFQRLRGRALLGFFNNLQDLSVRIVRQWRDQFAAPQYFLQIVRRSTGSQ